MGDSQYPRLRVRDEELGSRRYERVVLRVFDSLSFLLRPFDVNVSHVRTLFQARLRLRGRRKRTGSASFSDVAFVLTCVMMVIFGLGVGFAMGLTDGAYWRIPIGLSATLMFLTLTLASELGELASDRAEVDLVLPAPVDDSAVLVARLLYIGEMVFTLTFCIALGPLFLGGNGLAQGFLFWLCFYSVALALTAALSLLGMLLAYMVAIRVFGPARFKSIVSWFQVFVLASFYLVLYSGRPIIERFDLTGGEVGSVWHGVWPPFWYSGLYEVLVGNVTPTLITFAILAVVVPPVALMLSLRLARRHFIQALAAPPASSDLDTRRPRAGWLSRWGRLVCRNRQQHAAYDWAIAMAKRETTFRVRVAPSILIMLAMGVGMVLRGDVPVTSSLVLAFYITIVLAFVATEGARVTESSQGRGVFAASPAFREVELRIGVTKALCSVFVVLPGLLMLVLVGAFAEAEAFVNAAVAFVWSLALTVFLARGLCKRLPFTEPVKDKLQPNMAAGFLPMILGGIIAALHFGATEIDGAVWVFAGIGVVFLIYEVVSLERLRPVRSSELSSAM